MMIVDSIFIKKNKFNLYCLLNDEIKLFIFKRHYNNIYNLRKNDIIEIEGSSAKRNLKIIFIENNLTKHISETGKIKRVGKLVDKHTILDIETNSLINTNWYWFLNDKNSIDEFVKNNYKKTIKYEYKVFGDFNKKEFQAVIQNG